MSNQSTISTELENIAKVLWHFPDGASIEEISQHIYPELPIRTLQRRLSKLQTLGKLRIEGKTRSTTYHLVYPHNIPKFSQSFQVEESQREIDISGTHPQHLKNNFPKAADKTFSTTISLSASGEQILALVNRPLQQRTPVGYQREFLEDYQPNKTFYLSQQDIEMLTDISKVQPMEMPGETYHKDLLNRLMIDLSWNSSRLEGNTYSLLDTQRLIAFGEMPENKSLVETRMILNHKDAIELLVQSPERIGFNRYTILNLHAALAHDLLPDADGEGRLRIFSVGISQSVYIPLAIPQAIAEHFDIILDKAARIINPFEQAFFAMVHLPYLQPFEDVNKRVSRLAANIPLMRHGISPLSFVGVPHDLYIQGMLGVYELNRTDLLKDVFLWAYEQSSKRYAAVRQSLGEPDPFRLKYRKEIKDLVFMIVSECMTPKETIRKIQANAEQLPKEDQAKFIEVVDTAILSLHEGNIAPYHIQPEQFEAWQKGFLKK
ncbi:MAG: Fic family protein [Gammaproteobacteria bacterium]|jgi:hypothetical protein|nr:Fic family protein [Gammaproteobacteria bacterium]